MVLHGVLADEQAARDLLDRVLAGHELENLQLADGQAWRRQGSLWGTGHDGELADDLRYQPRTDQDRPGVDRPDGRGERVDLPRPQQVARGSRLDRGELVGLVVASQ